MEEAPKAVIEDALLKAKTTGFDAFRFLRG
jgi:hypothetical protein